MSLENETPFNLEAELMETMREHEASPQEEAPPSASPTAETPSESTDPKSDDATPPVSDEPVDPEKLMEELSLNDPAIRELLRQQQQQAQQPYPPQQYAPQAYAPPVPQYVPQTPPQSDNAGEYFDFTDPNVIAQLAKAQVQEAVQPLLEKVQQQEALIQQQAMQEQATAIEETVFSHVEQLNPELGKLIRDTQNPKAQALGEFGAKAYLEAVEKYPPQLRNNPAVIQNATKAMMKDPIVKALADAFLATPKPKQVAPTQGYGGTPPQGTSTGTNAYLDRYGEMGGIDDLASYLATP
jgi:hypothetical protein